MDISAHHAYLITGSRGEQAPSDFFAAHGLAVPSEANVVMLSYQSMGIDDARALFSTQLRKSDEAVHTIYLIEAAFITREAQNAMLKMLEEPTPRTHFVLATPHAKLLLPTLQSRFTSVAEKTSDSKAKKRAAFSSLPFVERMEAVEPLLEEGNRSTAEQFLKSLIAELDEQRRSKATKHAKLIGQLDRLHDYITDPSSSVKLILEYVVFMVPSS